MSKMKELDDIAQGVADHVKEIIEDLRRILYV